MATSAWQINNDFEVVFARALGRGKTGYVWVNFAKGGGAGYELVAFETVDKGLIIIVPTSHQEVELEVGKRFSELVGFATPYFDDTITLVTVIW